MKCPRCNSENALNSVYCQECGFKLQSNSKDIKKKRNEKILIVAIIISAIVIFSIGTYFVYGIMNWTKEPDWKLQQQQTMSTNLNRDLGNYLSQYEGSNLTTNLNITYNYNDIDQGGLGINSTAIVTGTINGHYWNGTWKYSGVEWIPIDFHRI